MRYVDFQQRIAIRCGPDDRLGADIAAGAWPVLDDELLPEALGKPLSDQTSHDVGNAAGRISDDNTHRPRRIALRPRDPCHSRQRGSAGGQMQKLSAEKFHGSLPEYIEGRALVRLRLTD